MDARGLLALVVAWLVMSSCTPGNAQSPRREEENSLYVALARRPDAYTGKYVHFEGKVIHSVQSGSDSMLRVNVTRGRLDVWKDTVYVEYHAHSPERIIEGDVIIFGGRYAGIKPYQAALGQTVQIPYVVACDLQRTPGFVTVRRPCDGQESASAAVRANAPPSAYERGLAALKSGEFDQAIIEFTSAINANPKDVFSYLKRAVARVRRGESEAAIADYRLAISNTADEEFKAAIRRDITKLERGR